MSHLIILTQARHTGIKYHEKNAGVKKCYEKGILSVSLCMNFDSLQLSRNFTCIIKFVINMFHYCLLMSIVAVIVSPLQFLAQVTNAFLFT
jgi:hypothetical protein